MSAADGSGRVTVPQPNVQQEPNFVIVNTLLEAAFSWPQPV
jgi:hypothetical protein